MAAARVMLTGTMTASMAFMPANITCRATTKVSQMMRNVVMFMLVKTELPTKSMSTTHWKPPTSLTQLARDMAKPSCRKAGQAKVLLTSLKLHTPMPGQSMRKTVTKTM